MRNRTRFYTQLVGFLVLSLMLLSTACQQASALPEYRKYEAATDVPKVSIEDAKKDVDAGIAVIVDSRSEGVYMQEHIAGSINIPNGSPKEKYVDLPKNKKVIVYCSCAGEGSSIALAYQMNQAGVANTYALTGGTQAWKNAGLPMTTSPVVIAQ